MDKELFFFFNTIAGPSSLIDATIIFLAEHLQYVLIAFFILLLFFSRSIGRNNIQVFWVTVISIIVARLGVTELIRLFYHRPRPFLDFEVQQLIFADGYSFPSGHSSFFFAMAVAIFLYNKKWGSIFFAASIAMNISRIVAGVHYPSDIIGGMLVGIVIACVVYYVVGIKQRLR